MTPKAEDVGADRDEVKYKDKDKSGHYDAGQSDERLPKFESVGPGVARNHKLKFHNALAFYNCQSQLKNGERELTSSVSRAF